MYRIIFYSKHKYSNWYNFNNNKLILVESGIGKVNAAVAATALAEQGVHIILNCGLSGGISGIGKNEISIPNKFLEHDFDLSGLGYKLCQKPGQRKHPLSRFPVYLRQIFNCQFSIVNL